MTKTNRRQAKKRLFVRITKRLTKASMSAVGRVVLLLVMVVLFVFCAAWIWLVRTLNAQHVSEVITQQLQEKLNRPVMISSLDLKFLNTLELKGFSVIDTNGEPGRAFVSADSVTLAFELLPLLENKLVIDEVTLNAPRFNLVRSTDGVYNVPQVRLKRQTPSTYTSNTGRKFEVSIANWTIKDGVLSFKDLASGASHALYGMDMHFEDLRFDELSPFTLSMMLRNQWQGKISEMEINAQGQINWADFNWKKFTLRGLKTQVYLFKNPVDLTLDLANLEEPLFTLSATSPSFTAKDVSVFGIDKFSFEVPAATLTAQGALNENYTKLTLNNVQVQTADIELKASGKADFAQEPASWQMDFSTNSFTLPDKKELLPLLAPYKLTGRASVSGQVARSKGKISLPLLTVKAQDVAGNFYGFKAANVTGEFQAKNNFADLYARTQRAKVEVARTTFDKMVLSGSWRKGNLYAYIASSRLNDVPFKMNLSVDQLKKNTRKIRTNLHFETFDPMAFIETVKDFVTVITAISKPGPGTPEVTGELAWLRNFRDRLPDFMPNLAGTLSANKFVSAVLSGNDFKAEFDLTGLQAGAKMLSGPLELKLQNGVIHQMEKLAAEQEALNVTFQPFIMMHRMERAGSFSVGRVLKDVEVQELAASVRFAGGGMEINNAYTVGPTISAAVSGWTDWVKETFDLTIFTMFTNTSKSGVLAENLTDESGSPALAFRVSSSMTKPKLEMLRAKKAGKTIRDAQQKGVNTDFSEIEKFIQGEFHATK